MATLKVYRTPIGFHDAYVAASSQKAALKAWGSDRDLFARGIAEVVTDAALTAEPLAQPGVVVKRSRGTAAEQIAALPPTPARARRDTKSAPAPMPDRVAARAPSPKPDRTALTAAERALSQAEARQRSEERPLKAEEAALAKRRRALERDHRDERDRLEAERQTLADVHDRAMRRWRG